MAESKPSSPTPIAPILDLLASAGYGDANSDDLSDFDKLFRGLAWCISSSDHPRKIDTVEDIEVALKSMRCPHALQAAHIEDLHYPEVYHAVQWIVNCVKPQQRDSNYEAKGERKSSVLPEIQLLKEKIEEAGIDSLIQKLTSLLKKSEALERQGNKFQSDCNLHRHRLQTEITELEDLTHGNDDKDPHHYLDSSISDLSNKLKFAKKEFSSKLRESISLKRQLDEPPIEAELVQYERRFSELNVHMQDRLHQTRKYYETYNALLEIKDLMLKETSLLNSVESQFGNAIGNPAGRTQLIDSLEAILKGIRQKIEKVQFGLQMGQKNLDSLREQYNVAVTNQRQCSILLKDFHEECKKNDRLKKEFGMQEKQSYQTFS